MKRLVTNLVSVCLMLIVVLSCSVFYLPVAAETYTTTPVKTWDFESMALGTATSSSLSVTSASGASVVSEAGNKCLKLEYADSEAKAYYEKRTIENSANVFAVSMRFMIKDASTKGAIVAMTGLYGSYQKNYIRIQDRDLYISDSATSGGTKIYDDIELNKWYSVIEVLNSSNITREFWISDQNKLDTVTLNKYSPTSGQTTEYTYARRWATHINAGAIYIDDVKLYELKSTNWSAERIRLRAESIRDTETLTGYENGKYPECAFDMLMDELASSNDSSTLSSYLSAFKSTKKIDESSASTDAAFVQALTSENQNVIAGGESTITLSAAAKTISNQPTSNAISWSVVQSSVPGFSVNGNSLTVPALDSDATVKLKASAGDLYTYLDLNIHATKLLENAGIIDFENISAKPAPFTAGDLKVDPSYYGRSLYTTNTTNTLSAEMSDGGVVSYDLFISAMPSTAQSIMELPGVIKIYAGEDGLLYYGCDDNKTAFATYPLNEWFTITLPFDIEAQKAGVYMNGVLYVPQTGFIDTADSVGSVVTTSADGIYIDNVYTATAENIDDAEFALNGMFAKKFRYVESMDRIGDTIVVTGASKNFASEFTLCGAADGSESGGKYVTYEGKTAVTFTSGTGNAIKTLLAPISSGVVKFTFDAYISEAADVSLLKLKNGALDVLTFKILKEGNGEGGTKKATINDNWCGIYGATGWNNISIIVDFDNNKATLYINGVPGNEVALEDFSVDAVEVAGQIDKTYFDNLQIEAFSNVAQACTAVAMENLLDEIIFNKASNFFMTKRNIASTEAEITSANETTQVFLTPNNYQRDKYGEIKGIWEDDFNDSSDDYVHSGHAKITRVSGGSKVRYLKNVKNEAGGNLSSGIWTTEFDFMMEEKMNASVITQIYNGDGSKKVCSLRVDGGKIQTLDAGTNTLMSTFTEGRWYTIGIRLNLDKQRIDYFVDGHLVYGNKAFANSDIFTYTTGSEHNTNRMFDTFNNNEDCEYWIDNVRVFKDAQKPIVSISSPLFKDYAGNETWRPTSGGKLHSVMVSNKNNVIGDLYAAVYVGTKLETLKKVESVVDGMQVLDLPLPNTSEKMDVRFFVWEGSDLIPIIPATPYQKNYTKLFVLSDSIYDGSSSEHIGIGDKLQDYLNSGNVVVYNKARSGYTLANIASGGYLNEVLDMVEPGDYVLISFAHNDEKPTKTSDTFAPVEMDMQAPYAHETYQARLIRYAEAIRLRGGNPVFATSLARYRTDAQQIGQDHGNYIQAMKNVATEIDVPLIDLNAYSIQCMNDTTMDASSLYLYRTVSPTDTTHVSDTGADFFAKWVVDQMKQLGLAIGDYAINLN